MGKPVTKIERRIVEIFFKLVGAGTGLFDFQARQLREGAESEPLYQSNLEQVRRALKGMLASDLEDFIRERYRAGDRAALLSEILSKRTVVRGRREWDTDLLPECEGFVHPQLFVRTMPHFAVSDQGMVPVSRGSITARERFTVRELSDYYYHWIPVAWRASRHDAQLGAWNWLLDQARLDELLFTIDAAWRAGAECAVIELTRYFPMAREEIYRIRARQSEGR